MNIAGLSGNQQQWIHNICYKHHSHDHVLFFVLSRKISLTSFEKRGVTMATKGEPPGDAPKWYIVWKSLEMKWTINLRKGSLKSFVDRCNSWYFETNYKSHIVGNISVMTMDDDFKSTHCSDDIYIKVAGGEEKSLDKKLPDGFKVKSPSGTTWYLTGAIELHRLVLEDYDQLERRAG